MPTLGAIAQTNEPYVVLKDGTATFYYNSSKSTGALPLQSDWDDSNWPNDTRNSVTKVVFDASFKDCKPTSCAYWFYQFKNLIEISGIKENLNTANVTNMGYMFHGCSSLTTLDLSNFNTANVTNMGYMFRGCSSLTTLDVSNFNTANVKNMSSMFSWCTSLTTIDVSNFNTANVTTMVDMFFCCSSLNAIFVGDDWSTASVTESSCMFFNCTKLFGGKGTRCTGADSHIDATYAKIDGGESDPGYLTKSGEPIFKGIISIEISTMPKTDYKVGEDFEIADGTLTLTYNNGETENINLSNAKITGFDKTKIGEQTLKVEYQGVETTLTTPVSFIPDTQTDVIVWSFNSTIYLETLPDTKYTIIDLNGRTIKSATTKSSHEEISITKSGVYIVLVNGESYKVSIN